MGRFLGSEKVRQAAFRANSDYFTPEARPDGVYKGRARPFCLPAEHAGENLYPGIREAARAYFAGCRIKWHDGQVLDGELTEVPSNHLCDSQVCCVNFLFPFCRSTSRSIS